LHWTDIIEVPKEDIAVFYNEERKGFSNQDLLLYFEGDQLEGTKQKKYRNGVDVPSDWGLDKPCPYNGGKFNGNSSSSSDPETYFYKGVGDSDCIQFLVELGLV
jgi:hypothetical protein